MIVLPDNFGVPDHVFGPLDPDLPALIGRIVMLGALLETKVAALRSALEGVPEATVASIALGTNLRESMSELHRFEGVAPPAFLEDARALLSRVSSANQMRNSIVHRVWSHAGVAEWAGWKPTRADEVKPPEWTDWKRYTREGLMSFLAELVALEREVVAICPSASAYRYQLLEPS